ncbi:cell division protein CrgA [Brevibacterium antiquum]|uniref:Cell division protein CrgA n=1 Tax=Brevibacterium antiquum TaxID=234835 RepID=A0A2H1J1F1_9MICO|nr:cell division protein CrgA [Brevibacterium antiquum]SMX81249.1 Uncharacterised protein family (UPF0233) [Brevibacterium antiquum]
MAKSNGRTQRPQRTSRNSSKADVETKAQPNDDIEAVEDLQAEQTEDLKHEPLDGDILDLDDSSDRSDVVADGAGTDGNTDTDAEAADDDKAAGDTVAEKSTAGTGKKSASKSSGAKQAADAKKADAKKTEKSDKGSKPTKKSEAATGASAKGSAAQGSSAKRTSRSGNPAKRTQGRKAATYTSQSGQQTLKPNPRWFLPVLIGLLLIGLIWLVTFYVSERAFPVEAWGNWNILVGFAFFVAGLIMSTRWR